MILRLLAPRLAVAANALLVTEEPEVATCAANRHSDIRAFVATDPASLAKARQAIGGNLLIVNRVKCPDHSIREMACDMARHPARVPAQWRAVL
jgi:hypothetical protein